MLAVALVLAALAGLLHVYIFVLESLRFDRPEVHQRFRTRTEDVPAVRAWAYNQGFYNLFLAIVTAIGIAVTGGQDGAGYDDAGPVLVLAGVGSMLAAAVVLVASNPARASAATKQGLLPLLAVVAVVVGLA